MQIRDITIEGDAPGHDWRLTVLEFPGAGKGPRTYIQAALHAGELPGVAAAHCLAALLRAAEARGEILGSITLVPQANPIGTAQFVSGEMQGRFDLASRTNFNRGYPLVTFDERASLLEGVEKRLAASQLKRHLLSMAIDSEIMLDLHCDDQSLQYAYMHPAFWPEGEDLAAAMDMQAVFLSDGESDAFEEAVTMAWLRPDANTRFERIPGRMSTTVELRGTADVDPDLAAKDAAGLYRFLQARGVIGGKAEPLADFSGPVAHLDEVEMIRADRSGMVLFHKNIGEWVKKGERLVTLVTAPGREGGSHDLVAPQDGLIVTRASTRFARRSDNLMKIACREKTAEARSGGALED